MTRPQETVRVDSLATGYSGKKDNIVITRDINASLYSGELTCLLGPNGAGKSTLLKTLTAFLPPIKGEIVIGGKNLSLYKDSELAKVIGVVLTEKLSITNMTVEELVGMGRSPYTGFWGRMSAYDRRVVDESIELVNVTNLRGRMVQTLSDGERQKVMIAKSLAQETPIIFLDEPTAFLDYPSKVEIMQLLQRLSREKDKTVFLSTHDLELALQIADKVWLLDRPHGVSIGTPEDLSLKGLMSEYFRREGVSFDMETGLFRINHPVGSKIRIAGEGIGVNMVKKALARNGIMADESVSGSNEIIVDADGYIFQGQKYTTIEELLSVFTK